MHSFLQLARILAVGGLWLSPSPGISYIIRKLSQKFCMQQLFVMWVLWPGLLTLFGKTLKNHPALVLSMGTALAMFATILEFSYSYSVLKSACLTDAINEITPQLACPPHTTHTNIRIPESFFHGMRFVIVGTRSDPRK